MENKKDKIDIKVNDLITTYEKLKKYIERLDCKNTEHRQLAIQAMQEYIKRYVTPALYLMPNIDLDNVFGKPITGLCLNFVFDSKRENLNKPSDEEIDDVFEQVIELKPTSELRKKFWDSWLLGESFTCNGKLCNFLKEPLIYHKNKLIKPDVLNKEIEQIQYILTLEMPPRFQEWIQLVLEWEQKALDEWNKEETTSKSNKYRQI